jgi:hypothetical protein
MTRLSEQRVHSPAPTPQMPVSTNERWANSYGSLVSTQLRSDTRYALIRVGEVEFAYADFDRYLRALGQAWEAGLVPEPLPTTKGSELTAVAPNLRGVDLDLGDLSPDDVELSRGRFP